MTGRTLLTEIKLGDGCVHKAGGCDLTPDQHLCHAVNK